MDDDTLKCTIIGAEYLEKRICKFPIDAYLDFLQGVKKLRAATEDAIEIDGYNREIMAVKEILKRETS